MSLELIAILQASYFNPSLCGVSVFLEFNSPLLNLYSYQISGGGSTRSLHAKEILLFVRGSGTESVILDLVYRSSTGPLRPAAVLNCLLPVRDLRSDSLRLWTQRIREACAGGF